MARTDILSPLEQEGTKSVVRAWLKKPGDVVKRDDPVVELETDKVAVEVPAPADGVLIEVLAEPGTEAPPGFVLGRVDTGGKASAPPTEQRQSPRKPAANAHLTMPGASAPEIGFTPDLRLSPSVRRMLREKGIDPRALRGTGRDGRVTLEDVVRAPADGMPAGAQPKTAAIGASRRIAHTTMRRRIAEHMSASLREAPHVTAVFEADFTAVRVHRDAVKSGFEAKGVALTYTAYFIAACVEAMRVAPAVNSRWHADELEIFEDVNIGVGISLGDAGLVVPVVKRAQTLDLAEIAGRLAELTQKARSGKLAPADVQGGTFSISNHGVSGSLLAAPIIINQPQSAILGIGKLEKRIIVREVDGVDTLQIRPMAYVTLSIDHRVLDGHQTNAWLARFTQCLETWPATE